MKPGRFGEQASAAVQDEVLLRALDRATRRQHDGRKQLLAELPDALAMRTLAGEIRERALSRLDALLGQLADNIERAGGSVHWAATAEQACQIVVEIAGRADAKLIVKSKSMLTEEIELNDALTAAGLETVETDLGEYIVQLAGQKPSHIVGPAVHMTTAQIARLLQEKLGIDYTEDPTALTRAARAVLREKFRAADMGISGVNIAVAENGALCTVTNEGNGRFVTSRPPVYVAVMGMEKVVESMADLAVLLKLLARSATGQRSTVYANLTTGPRSPDETDGPREFHLVIVDAGRSQILGGPFWQVLKCIRCGACLNACPVYRKVGGHAYQSVYPGPIGKLLTPLLDSLRERAELPHASSLCGACFEACPVRINIPHLLIRMRRLLEDGRYSGYLAMMAVRMWAWMNTSQGRYAASSWMGRHFLDAAATEGWCRHLPMLAANWTEHRDFPAMAETPFHKLWNQLEGDEESPSCPK